MTKGMVSYAFKPKVKDQSAQAAGNDLTCHYKQMSEVGRAIAGMKLEKAKAYLQRVLVKKDVIPYMRHKGGKGRHAQAKNHKWVVGSGFPSKSTQMMLKLLENVSANAAAKSNEKLSAESLVLKHVQVNRARKMRRRTFRAHGRMGPYVRSPCHVELVVEPEEVKVAKPASTRTALVTRKSLALKRFARVPEGGGAVAKKA